jgi:hypothetical protein
MFRCKTLPFLTLPLLIGLQKELMLYLISHLAFCIQLPYVSIYKVRKKEKGRRKEKKKKRFFYLYDKKNKKKQKRFATFFSLTSALFWTNLNLRRSNRR